MKYFRFACTTFLFAALFFTFAASDAVAQGNSNPGNAHVMDISLQFDADADTVACLGDPSVLTVKPGDVVVFRAVGTFVNHVRWADEDVSQQAGLNAGKPNLTSDKVRGKALTGTGMFDRGRAFAVHISTDIENRTEYALNVKCGKTDDAPPVIIVDP